ncbi:MAG: ABC transporter ATP-binding protein [Treponema sp. GWB1_62_6]|nr:MAG: ABC transporter ATP-binding protein [Treponema sp. GWA1_62_8]OHE63392.1 MAG: ABC transporter ATP-binding protein [Treponema sp. GWB1_62_6]OHE65048.1 MAG: ABC transporter ATP-binding protein [Treponema sp. GWC1_61_84]OHE72464.1 MAG: ABC transporter ATP-binding protein [Treponema sp. RIFOXYC1_FULL_61_9]HCM26033.1 ABC transporter ATP-binding protein [Treponema sp.]
MAERAAARLFEIRGLRKLFPDGTEALAGVDLDIEADECLVIAGSNGSGKTLLMRTLVGLTDSSEGSALFRGVPVAKDPGAVRRAVGLVFQDADAQLVGETVEEDIAFGPRNLRLPQAEITARVAAALEAVGLSDKRKAPPRRLSGGEKRRLAIAGVLAMGCEAIIMDEPFANLDWPGVEQVLRAVSDLRSTGHAVVVLTHELEKILAHADRLAILDRGSIRDCGKPAEVLGRGVAAFGVRDPRQRYDSVEDCTWLE